jgi:hypothetical protein
MISHSWPSGLRRSTQVRIYSYAWVQIPLDANTFLCRALFVNFWICLNLNLFQTVQYLVLFELPDRMPPFAYGTGMHHAYRSLSSVILFHHPIIISTTTMTCSDFVADKSLWVKQMTAKMNLLDEGDKGKYRYRYRRMIDAYPSTDIPSNKSTHWSHDDPFLLPLLLLLLFLLLL